MLLNDVTRSVEAWQKMTCLPGSSSPRPRMAVNLVRKKGDWVALSFGSGNHDPEVFERPNEFILNRPNVGKNLTFSHGIHHCIAALVARNEAAEMVNGILDRYKRVEPGNGSVVYQDKGFIN